MDLLELASDVLDRARAKGVQLSTAESCTGGLIFATLTEIAGSSDVMDRGFVTYSNDAKSAMLGVPPDMILKHGAVSEQVARAMADGALANSCAGLSLAVTGVAGPGGTRAKPEGMVCFGLACTGGATTTETCQFGALGRSQVRIETVRHAFQMALTELTHFA